MQQKHFFQWLTLAMIIALVVAGCSPRAGQGETAQLPGAEQFAVDLPAITLDFDAEGNASMGGVPLAQLAAGFGVTGLDAVKLEPADILQITDANIQHIQINTAADGLRIMVNGQEIPSLAWDAEQLATAAESAGLLGGGLPAPVNALLPIISKLGAGITINFPLAQGAEIIPAEVTGEGSSATAAQAAQDAFLTEVGSAPKISIPIIYDAEGNPAIGDLTATDLAALTGQALVQNLTLPESMLKELSAAGVKELVLSTDPDGLHLAINGKALPYLRWGNGRLDHLINVAGQLGLLEGLGEDGEDAANVVSAIQNFLPILVSSQVEIRVILPE